VEEIRKDIRERMRSGLKVYMLAVGEGGDGAQAVVEEEAMME